MVIVLKPIGVVAIATVFRAARRLNIGDVPRLWPQRTQHGGGVACSCPNLHIIRLQNGAALTGPEVL